MVFVLCLHAADETKDARDGRLRHWPKDSQPARMGACLGRQVNVAISTHKGTSEEVCAIESNY